MYERLVEILKISKERKVDVGVACDMAKTENKDKNYDDAFKFLRKNFNDITALWTEGKTDELKKYCEAVGVVENEQTTD